MNNHSYVLYFYYMNIHSYVSMKSDTFFRTFRSHFNKTYAYFPHPSHSHTKKSVHFVPPLPTYFSFSRYPQLKKQTLTYYPDFYDQNVSLDKFNSSSFVCNQHGLLYPSAPTTTFASSISLPSLFIFRHNNSTK